MLLQAISLQPISQKVGLREGCVGLSTHYETPTLPVTVNPCGDVAISFEILSVSVLYFFEGMYLSASTPTLLPISEIRAFVFAIMLSFTLLILVLASLLIYFSIQRAILAIKQHRFIKQHNCRPPTQSSSVDSVIGFDVISQSYRHFKDHSYLEATHKRYLKHGNTFQANMMGMRIYNTIEPENIKTILSSRFEDFGLGKRRRAAFDSLLGHGILNTDGMEWSRSRRLLRPSFARDQWGDLAILEKHVVNLIDQIPHDGSSVDLQALFFRMTMDTATELFFGESAYSLTSNANAELRGFAAAFNRTQRTIAVDFCLGPFNIFSPRDIFSKDCKYLHDFVDSYVRKALVHRDIGSTMTEAGKSDLEQCNERYVVLHELVKRTDDLLQLRSESLGLLVAGRDTTASLLGNLWFILARRQDVWTRLQEEISGLKGAKPDLSTLKEMKYLQGCLNEGICILSPFDT